jgi:hypothetical protein
MASDVAPQIQAAGGTKLPVVCRPLAQRATHALLTLFAVELILGGPGYWQVGGLSIRRTLLALVTVWLLGLLALGRLRLRMGHLCLASAIALLMLVWIVFIPSLRGADQITDAVREGLPLAMVFTGILVHAFYSMYPQDWLRLRRSCARCLALVAVVTLVMWCIGSLLEEGAVVVVAGAYALMTLGSEIAEPALYIQRMPDGFFRVMWITSVLFVVGLTYAVRRRNLAGVVLFAAALFATYTRALWLVAVLALIVSELLASPVHHRSRRQRRMLMATLLVVSSLALVVIDLARGTDESVLYPIGNRLLTTFSDQSAEDRVDQAGPLVEAWSRWPLAGAGMGSSAPGSIRSDVAAYQYELTYLALLMKLGILGSLYVLAMLATLAWRAGHWRTASQCHAATVAFLLACSTNPYLLNLVGIGLLCFLFVDASVGAHREPKVEAAVPRKYVHSPRPA